MDNIWRGVSVYFTQKKKWIISYVIICLISRLISKPKYTNHHDRSLVCLSDTRDSISISAMDLRQVSNYKVEAFAHLHSNFCICLYLLGNFRHYPRHRVKCQILSSHKVMTAWDARKDVLFAVNPYSSNNAIIIAWNNREWTIFES